MEIRLDKGLYSKQVLLKTAFAFTDRVYLHLEQNSEEWIVSWKAKGDQEIKAEEFENELISQQLREQLIDQTADIRKILLARAFASSVLENNADTRSDEMSYETENREPAEASDDDSILKGWYEA